MDVSKPYQYALLDAVSHFRLDPTNILYIHEVFQCFNKNIYNLLLFWMSIWIQYHTISTTNIAQIWKSWYWQKS